MALVEMFYTLQFVLLWHFVSLQFFKSLLIEGCSLGQDYSRLSGLGFESPPGYLTHVGESHSE